MSNEVKKPEKWKPVLGTVAVVGGLGLASYGIYRLAQKYSVDVDRYREFQTEYFAEVHEYLDFYRGLVERGGPPTETEEAYMNKAEEDLRIKELSLEMNFPRTFLGQLASDIEELAKSMGLYIVLPIVAGYMFLRFVFYLKRHWPPSLRQPPPKPNSPPPHDPPPGPIPCCPHCGLQFSTMTALAEHIIVTHPVTINPYNIRQAQANFNMAPTYVQAYIAEGSGLYGMVWQDWAIIGAVALLIIAVTIAVIASAGAAAPAGGYALTSAYSQACMVAAARWAATAAVQYAYVSPALIPAVMAF